LPLTVKICGLSTLATVDAALDAGADMIGFVFHPRSPRFIQPAEAAVLSVRAEGRAQTVALFADADDAAIDAVLAAFRPDWLQLHGSEPPERCRALGARSGWRILKAVGVAAPGDLAALAPYRAVADRVLIDARAPKDAAYPGGHGRPFDWSILTALDPDLAFMLSGGLTPETVGDAVTTLRSFGVALSGLDVSSGVERAPGVKDETKIRDFVAAVRRAETQP